jgi:hypothetical protein
MSRFDAPNATSRIALERGRLYLLDRATQQVIVRV